MRLIRRVAVAAAITAGMLAWATPAGAAGGGAYVAFDRTYYQPGQRATGSANVFASEWNREVMVRGPFYAYLLSGRATIREGRPIPSGAIRLGAFSIARDGAWYRFRIAFTVPDVAGDFYSIMACNDPCTVSGFRQPLFGQLSVVATGREARLLRQQGRMQSRIWTLRRRLRKSDRENGDLQAVLRLRETQRSESLAELDTLRNVVTRLRAAAGRTRDPVIGAAGAWTIGGGLGALAAALVFRRRRRGATILVPDDPTPFEHPMERVGTR